MARIGKLTAIEVTKAKGPAVLHDGGGLYLRVSGSGANLGCSAINSTANGETWG